MKQSAIVVCPGRGTYNKSELGYLRRHHSDKLTFLSTVDEYRAANEQTSISELDAAEAYRSSLHSTGDNASLLIYACALADFDAFDLQQFEITAMTGNSMGWYLDLACAGALNQDNAIHLVNTMGIRMHEHGQGGQVIYPIVEKEWQASSTLLRLCDDVLAEANERSDIKVSVSIDLAGMRVFAADDAGVKWLIKRLPKCQERYPFALQNHAAFHSSLMTETSHWAKKKLPASMFGPPNIPLIDGRGKIWQPYATDPIALHEYTLGYQIDHTYDFTAAMEVAIKELAPEKIIVLGPGTTLGPPIAQALIENAWQGLESKFGFVQQQKQDPFVLSMGIEQQRNLVVHQGV